ncbi:acyl-CoA dehydrogenase [Streptomyces sp. NPDC048441]|uniref:acyl-CoA dehydrogenase family protein n=1 Tax=Streptomyces sp. NPDC048441 TaxID=3365552 RepID=UPI00371C442A
MTLLTMQKIALQAAGGTLARPATNDVPDSLDLLQFVAETASPPANDSSPTTTPVVAELMHQLFDPVDRARIHGRWRDLIAREEFRYVPGLSTAERTELSYRRLRLVNDTVVSPEQLARDPRQLASLHEWTAASDGALCALASIHYNLFLGSLYDHDERDDLSPYTSMQRTGTFLCSELEHGNDAPALQTTAEFDRATGDFVLNTPGPGAQKFMPNTSSTGGPKSAVVAARLLVDGEDQGVFLFLTQLSNEVGPLPGIRVRRLPDRIGNPVDHCLTSFDHVRLPREALLEADHGRLTAEGVLNSSMGNRRKRFLQSIARVTTGKLCMSAASVGASRAALTIAVRYAHHRHISGPKTGERVPLTAHRSHYGRLLQGLATAYAMTFLHRTVTDRWAAHTPENRVETERLVAIAKAWITWQGRTIMIECRERCGAQGLFPLNGLADLQLDAEGSVTAEGDNLPLWIKAAAEMVFGHRTERLDARPASPKDQDLTDLAFLRDLLAEVEALWQTRACTALRQGRRGDPLGRWNAASSSGLEMVSAHARLQAADAFIAAIGRTADPAARSLLEDLCRLFLLQEISHHTGDLLAAGHLSADHIHALPPAIDTLVHGLAEHLTPLVEAFDLPAEYLAAIPIANSSYAMRVSDFLEASPN